MFLDDIHSNHKSTCVDCGETITAENDSGWQVFVSSRVTQKICKLCNVLRTSMLTGMKVSELKEQHD